MKPFRRSDLPVATRRSDLPVATGRSLLQQPKLT